MPARPHDPIAALRVGNYRLFVGGWLPATFGLQMQATALGWEIYQRTDDALALGVIGVARALPTVLLALPAGRIVDLVDRRRVLVATQVGFAVTGALLAMVSVAWAQGALGDGPLGLWSMYAVIALTGCARVFNGPSRSSLLPRILPGGASGEVFHNAIAWNSGVFQLAATLGPIVAGLLIAATGGAWLVYALSAATCLWFAFTATFIRQHDDAARAARAELLAAAPPESRWRRLWNVIRPGVLLPGMLEGVAHIRRERVVLGAIVLDLFAVLLGGATALMPLFARDILHVGPVGLGFLKAAPYIGAFLMALAIAHRPAFRRAGPALLWSVAGFGLLTVVFGLSTSFWLSVTALALLGALDNISVVIRHVLVNVRTPDELRGRVAAVNSVFIECSNELGGFESGLVAILVNPVFSVVSGGVGTLLVVAATALWLPELRRLDRLSEPEAIEEAGG